jgi:hypothetical protein
MRCNDPKCGGRMRLASMSVQGHGSAATRECERCGWVVTIDARNQVRWAPRPTQPHARQRAEPDK